MAIIIMLLDLVLSAWPSIYGGQSLRLYYPFQSQEHQLSFVKRTKQFFYRYIHSYY